MNILVFLAFLGLICPRTFACNPDQTDLLPKKLAAIGFENVRVSKTGPVLSVSIEDPVFGWKAEGIRAALDTIARYAGDDDQLLLYLLEKDIPRMMIKVPVGRWSDFATGEASEAEIQQVLEAVYAGDGYRGELGAVSALNESVNKIDIVFYPQFVLQNKVLSQIYEIQLNLAPAVEVMLWKGMQFAGQVIFPLKNDLGTEGDHIRPGFVTLAQEFRLPRRWFGRMVAGNFNANRYGADLTFNHPLKNDRWEAGFNAGLTGSSYFEDGQWITSGIDRLTWSLRAGYYYPKYHLQLDLSYGSYINRDRGFRADCTRHFGATAIGFYAMRTGGELNGGFHFAIPLPPHKRQKRHAVRLVPSRFFDWEYNAGTEFYYGRYYETRPNENRSESRVNPGFIKSELLKPVEK